MAWVQSYTTLQDCAALATRLRREDLREILASRPGISATDALIECVQVSYKTFTVMEDGIGCIAIFGVRKTTNGGVPWMITSEHLFGKSCRKFIKQCKSYVKELTEDFDYCFNYVSETNTKAHSWLTWLGFTLDKTHTYTLNGVVFYPFTYTRNKDV